jgi:hypothetical protein
MVGTGNGRKRHLGGLPLIFLFGVVLFCLAFPATAADGLVKAWAKIYKGGTYPYNEAKAIAVDGQGNVYVTGFSWGDETGWDYATVKYGPDGQRLWVRRYHETADYAQAEPSAIVVDALGNIYVTGSAYLWTEGVGGNYDFLTIKYVETSRTER